MLLRSLDGEVLPPPLLAGGEEELGDAGWLPGAGDRCGDVLGLTVSKALAEGLDFGLLPMPPPPPRLYGANRCWPLVVDELLLLVGVVGGSTGGGADAAAAAASVF